MQYLELFDTASHACGSRQEGHPVTKTLLQYSSSTLLKRECYEEEVQPHRKTDYKPIIYIYGMFLIDDGTPDLFKSLFDLAKLFIKALLSR